MASNTIKGAGDIYEKDLYGDLAKSANEALPLMKKLNEVLKATTASNLKLVESQAKDVEGLKKVNEGVNKTNKAFEQKLKLDKETIKLEAKIKAGRTKQAQDNTVLKVQLQAENKVRTTLAKSTLKLTGAYAKESAKLNDLRKKYKDLAVSEKGVSKEQKKLIAQITKLDTKLKKVDKTVGQSQRNVGNYGSAFSRAGNALKGFAGALGITAGIAGLSRVITNSIKIIRDFEQGNANLASILGTTKDNITALTDDAKRLGSTTSFTATQVSELQTEFAKLGFNEQEILNATEATLDLAAATGSELGEAAAIAGATLGGFGLDAKETGRVADVMAKSFSTSALDLEKFKESMKDAAPAAKAVGVSVEKTTALLGTLSNAGISGSKAGTALKAGFIELNAAGITLDESLLKIANSNDKLSTATALVGKRAATSFLVLADGVEVTKELEIGLNNAGGAAKKMADEQLDTLSGSLKILSSAWEGFILSMNDAGGVADKLKKAVQFLSNNLTEIISTIFLITKAFVTFKAVMFSLKMADRAKEWKAYRTEVKKGGTAMSGATSKAKGFGRALKGIGLALAITALLELAVAFYDIASGAAEARRQEDLFNKSNEKSSKLAEDFNKRTDGVIKRKQQEFELLVATNKMTKKQLDIELKTLSVEKKKQALDISKQATDKIKSIKAETAAIESQIRSRTVNASDFGNSISAQNRYANAIDRANDANRDANKEIVKNSARIIEQEAIVNSFNNIANETTDTIHDYTVNIADNSNKLTKNTKDLNDNTEAIRNNLNLDRYNDFLKAKEELENEYLDKQLSDQQQEINDVEDKYFTILEQTKQYVEDKGLTLLEEEKAITEETKILEEARQKALDDIREKYRKKKEKDDADADKKNDNDRQKIADKQAEKDKAEAEQRVAIQQALLSKLEEISAKASQKKIDELDEQLEASKDNQDRLRELAAKGSLDAQQSISVEAKKQADLKRAKEKEERKQELVSAGFKIFSALLDQGKNPVEAGTETALILGALPAMIDAIPTAFEGTESTGTVKNSLDSNGGRLMLLHDNERVMTEKQNNKMGGIGNDEAANIIEKYNMGELFNYNTPDVSNNLMGNINLNGLNKGLERKIDTLNESIKAIKIPETTVKSDELRNMLIITKKLGNKTETERSKLH